MADALTALTPEDLAAWLRRASTLLAENSSALNELDAAIGDADHGSNMKRGFAAVVTALDTEEFADIPALMKRVGMTLVSSVGGASGPLYGTFFLRLGTSQPGSTQLDAPALLSALRAGVGGIEQRGKATVGEKTMLDAWAPALDAFEQASGDGKASDLAAAVRAGADGAEQGREATIPLQASKGRASYLGERSIGHVDPGAASTALLWQALAETVSGQEGSA